MSCQSRGECTKKENKKKEERESDRILLNAVA